MKKLVLTSVNQLITLVQNNSSLVANVPALATIHTLTLSKSPQKSCNCGGARNIITADANKQLAEQVLSSLTTDDFTKIKNTLSLDSLCYYRRNTEQNKLEMICI